MQIHNIKKSKGRIKSVSVGRGGKRGKTSGRGTKGQKARAGRKIRPEIRDFIKRLPKLRGRGKNFLHSIKEKNIIINLSELIVFKDKKEINAKDILTHKGIRMNLPVKILGNGEGVSINIKGCLISKSAREKIEKAGGKIL